ncbi:MAG: ABC transporter substrate-binding protein [Rhizobiales bacterium]|nr:ABC transporter substrate-binding protein [Hyphomicrobiales bacterium]
MAFWPVWRRYVRLIGVVLLLVAGTAMPAQAGKRDDTLTWATTVALPSAEPYYNISNDGLLVISQMVWDTLIYRDPDSGQYKPLLATAWRWIDPLTLELDLRRDVRFHDGRPFSADDVVYTINFALDPANRVSLPSNVNWLRRAEKTGSHQVRLLLRAPFPTAFEYLSGPIAIMPAGFYQNTDANRGPPASRYPGTGPYRLTRWEPGREAQFDINPEYMAGSPKGRPSIPRLIMRVVPDADTQVTELTAGRLDWIGQVAETAARRLAAAPNIRVLTAQSMRIAFLQFDVQGRSGPNPFQNLRVREAVAHAIDRDAIVRNVIGAGSRSLQAFCFPSQFGCTDDVRRIPYDPAKARQLLTEAGYPNGFDTEIIGFRARPRVEALSGFLNASGIRARLAFMGYGAVRERQQKGQVQLLDTSWGSLSINDVSALITPFFTNRLGDMVQDAEIRSWAAAAATAIDPQERRRLYGLILRKIADNVLVLPLYTLPSVTAFVSDLAYRAWPDENPRFYMQRWR